jgi:hypothetical protein
MERELGKRRHCLAGSRERRIMRLRPTQAKVERPCLKNKIQRKDLGV